MSPVIPDLAKQFEAERRAQEKADHEYWQYRRNLSSKKWMSLGAMLGLAVGAIFSLPEYPWLALLLCICEVIAAIYYYVYSLSDGLHEGYSQAREKHFGKERR